MPYPLDDNGNIRVDFVWGNVPMQPDELRTDQVTERAQSWNQPGDRGWTASSMEATSDALYTTYDHGLSVGDQSVDVSWQEPDQRLVEVPSFHDIIKTGYNNYPAYIPDYSGDGDIALEFPVPDLSLYPYSEWVNVIQGAGFIWDSNGGTSLGATLANDQKLKEQVPPAGALVEAGAQIDTVRYIAPTVPNVVGLTESAANTALTGVSLVKGAVTTANNAAGATAENDGLIKTQSVASGTKVDSGTAVALVKYAYVAETVYTTGPISNIVYDAALPAGDYKMYLVGRTVKPVVGNIITTAGNANSWYNTTGWQVISVANDDAFNTGGTLVVIRNAAVVSTITPAVGGTWTKTA